MKSLNSPLIILTLIALLCIGFQKIDCQYDRRDRPPRDYGNVEPYGIRPFIPVNRPKNLGYGRYRDYRRYGGYGYYG
jgi:hypothetical protein